MSDGVDQSSYPPADPDDPDIDVHEREGLPADAVILTSTQDPPMTAPTETWAMLVLGIFMTDGELQQIAGTWLVGDLPAQQYDGDLALRLTPRTSSPARPLVDVELWQSYQKDWHLLGAMKNQSTDWPAAIAPAAAAFMTEYMRAVEGLSVKPTPASDRWHRHRIRDLLEAGLLAVDGQLYPPRQGNHLPEPARVDSDGRIVLLDGRSFVDPTSAATAVCGYPRNGWRAFWHTADGRPLGRLLTELDEVRDATLARLAQL